MNGTNLLARAALLAGTAMALVATPAFAQDVPSASAETTAAVQNDVAAAQDSGEIVVTARRRAESLQDVPIAVTAFIAESLDRLNVEDLSDLDAQVPNLTIYAARGEQARHARLAETKG